MKTPSAAGKRRRSTGTLPASSPRAFALRLSYVAGFVFCAGMLGAQTSWRSALYPVNPTDPSSLNLETEKVIQDFSYAGYRAGRALIPDVAGPIVDVTQAPYLADPTGATTSTKAIQDAINYVGSLSGGGVVYLPPGTYLVSVPVGTANEALLINKPNVVLRGAGAGVTFLLNGKTILNTPTSTATKAVIRVVGSYGAAMNAGGSLQTAFTDNVLTATRVLPVVSTTGFAVGQTVSARIDLTSDWITETKEQDWEGQAAGLGGILSFRRTITAVDAAAGTITVDAPIRHPLKLRDNARLVRLGSAPLTGVGIEDLSIGNVQNGGSTWGEEDYSNSTTAAYAVHGSNLIEISRARDCWVRRVDTYRPAQNTSTAHLLSNGIRVNGSTHVTISDCVFQRPQYGGGGGNGYMFTLYASQECLIENSEARFSRHGFDISALGASGNVIKNCVDAESGYATGRTGQYHTNGMSSDHHKHLSMANLFDVCTADGSWFEAVYRPYGGTPIHGITATHSVFWNTSATNRVNSRTNALPGGLTWAVKSDQAGWGYVIGTRGARTAVITTQSTAAKDEQTGAIDHVEGVGLGDTLEPFSLHDDQVRRRLLPSVTLPAEVTLTYPADAVEVTPSAFFVGPTPSTSSEVQVVWSAVEPGVELTPLSGGGVRARVPGSGDWILRARAIFAGLESTRQVVLRVPEAVSPATYTLSSSADSYVRGGVYENDNYGGSQNLLLKTNASVGFTRRGLIRFDQSPVAGALPFAARLGLTPSGTPPSGASWSVGVHALAATPWSESGVTWKNAPAFGAQALVTYDASGSERDWVDVGDAYLALGGTGPANMEFGLSINAQATDDNLSYASRNHATAAWRPVLAVDAYPATSNFEHWIGLFTSIPSGSRGIDADPDSDGLANLAEMLLGRNPAQAETSFPVAIAAGATTIEFTLSATPPALTRVALEISPDNQNWTPVPIPSASVSVLTDGRRVVSVPVASASATRHWRLRAWQEPLAGGN